MNDSQQSIENPERTPLTLLDVKVLNPSLYMKLMQKQPLKNIEETSDGSDARSTEENKSEQEEVLDKQKNNVSWNAMRASNHLLHRPSVVMIPVFVLEVKRSTYFRYMRNSARTQHREKVEQWFTIIEMRRICLIASKQLVYYMRNETNLYLRILQ